MKYLIIITMVILISAVLLVYFLNMNSLTSQFSLWGVSTKHIENFTIETKRTKGSDTTEIEAMNKEQTLFVKRITNMSEDSAQKYIKEQSIKLESIFDPARSPYFAILTKTIECPEKFLPAYKELSKDKSYYVLFANNRFSYGACTEDLIEYRAINGIVYCKNTGDLYHLEYFIPNNEYSEILTEVVSEFTCLL